MAITPKASGSRAQDVTTDADLRRQSQDLGRLGALLGSRDHAPIYIAGAIALIGMVVMGLAALDPWMLEANRTELFKNIGSIVLSALTFLGGVYSGGRR